MKASILSLFSLVLLFSSHSLAILYDSPKRDDLCNLLGGWYVTPQLCHSVLDTDPQSSTADLPGLGVIAANFAEKNATSVLADIQRLLSDASLDTNKQKALKTCLQLYTDVVPVLKGAAESIKAKKYSEAETVLSAAMEVPSKCFNAANDDTTVAGWLNKDNSGFSNVALAARGVAAYIDQYHSG